MTIGTLIVMFIMLVAIERLTSRINKLEKYVDSTNMMIKAIDGLEKKTKSCSIDGKCE